MKLFSSAPRVRGALCSRRPLPGPHNRRAGLRRGMTLIEISVVLFVLLMLTSLLWFAARSWKAGSDRVFCVMQIRHMQVSMRSYTHSSPYQPGQDLSWANPPVDLVEELVGPGKYVAEIPRCPSRGTYQLGGNVVPEVGELYMKCSLAATRRHEPEDYRSW